VQARDEQGDRGAFGQRDVRGVVGQEQRFEAALGVGARLGSPRAGRVEGVARGDARQRVDDVGGRGYGRGIRWPEGSVREEMGWTIELAQRRCGIPRRVAAASRVAKRCADLGSSARAFSGAASAGASADAHPQITQWPEASEAPGIASMSRCVYGCWALLKTSSVSPCST
jgi:hypothetical protein